MVVKSYLHPWSHLHSHNCDILRSHSTQNQLDAQQRTQNLIPPCNRLHTYKARMLATKCGNNWPKEKHLPTMAQLYCTKATTITRTVPFEERTPKWSVWHTVVSHQRRLGFKSSPGAGYQVYVSRGFPRANYTAPQITSQLAFALVGCYAA